jgi:hypothetical protein
MVCCVSLIREAIAVQALLTLIVGAVLLGGCAAKQNAVSAQNPSETASAGELSAPDAAKAARESGPGLVTSGDYERAVTDYNNCILDHTTDLSACEKKRAIMNGLGKVSSRSSLSQSYTLGNTQINNTTGIAQGANSTNTPQTTSSLPARMPPTIPEAAEAKPPEAPSTPTPTPF